MFLVDFAYHCLGYLIWPLIVEMQKSSYLYTSQLTVLPASVWQWSKLPSYNWSIANRKRNTTLVSVRQFSGDNWQSTSTTLTNIVSGDYFCVGPAMSYIFSVIKSLIGRRSVSEQRIVRPSIYARRVKYGSTINDQVTTGCQEKLHVDKGHQQISADCWTTRIFFVVLHRNTIDWQKIIGRHLLFSPISLVPSLGRRYHPIIERWNAVVDLYM